MTHRAARSDSSTVLSTPNENRSEAYASVSERPMAVSTCEGVGRAVVHAELCEQ